MIIFDQFIFTVLWVEEYDHSGNFDGQFFKAPYDGIYLFFAQSICEGNSQCWIYMNDSK